MTNIRILVLSGGVGGAKLLRGLYRTLPSGTLAALIRQWLGDGATAPS